MIKKSLLKITVFLVIIALNWSGLSAVMETISYYFDNEGDGANTFTAATLDFTLSAGTNFSPNISTTNNSAARTATITNAGILDFNYKITTASSTGFLCDKLNLTATTSTSTSPVSDLQTFSYVPGTFGSVGGNWTFTASLKSGVTDWGGKTCTFDIVFEGRQIGLSSPNGFFDTETITGNVVTSESSQTCQPWTTQADFDASASTFNNVVTTNNAGGEVQLSSSTADFGITSIGSPTNNISVGSTSTGTQDNASGYMLWESYTTAVPLTATKIYTYGTVSGNVKVAIYSDNAGTPGTKLTTEVSDAATANTWNEIPITSTYLPAGTYWIVFAIQTQNNIITASAPANASRKGKTWTYSSTFLNNPASSGTILTSINDRSDNIYFVGTSALSQQGYAKATKVTLLDNANISSLSFYSHATGNARLAIYDSTGSSVLPLSGWNYRKSHAITGSAGAGTGYQVRVVAHKSTGIDSGADVYLGTNVRDDFGDVRFTASDGTTLLNYWIETGSLTSGSQAIFWVKVAADLGSSQTIYIYYGNSEVTTTSNGANTFVLFDDFTGSSLDGAKWTKRNGGTPSFASGLMTVSANTADPAKIIATGGPTADNNAIVARFKVTGGTNTDERAGVGVRTANSSTPNGYNYLLHDFTNHNIFQFLDDGKAWGISTSFAWSKDTFYTMESFITGTTLSGRINYGSWYTQSTGATGWSSRSSNYLSLNIGSFDATTVWDWAFVRKCIANEPSHSTWEAEEASAKPNSKLWESNDISITTTGWQTVAINSGTPNSLQLNAGTYWLAWQWDNANGPSYTAGSSGDGNYISLAYGSFPSTWSGGTSTNEKWSIYASYITYASTGNLESTSFNAGQIASWQSLEWDEGTLPSGTDITLEAAISNNGSTWSAWQLSSGSTPINLASLTQTQYIKWRATLTSDASKTPVLHSVMVCYSKTGQNIWTQTTKDDFDAGNKTNIDTSTSPDDAKLTTTGGSETAILRPNAEGDHSDLSEHGEGSAHWSKVDEEISDGDTTYVYMDTKADKYDIYQLSDSSQTGTITSVEVTSKCRREDDSGSFTIRNVIKTNKTTSKGNPQSVSTSYTDYSDTYSTNPITGNAWTWTEIDALQVGPNLITDHYRWIRCTQVWVEVNYSTSAYNTSGTLESQSFDGMGMTNWVSLEWDENLPSGTDIKLAVSTCNTDCSNPLSWSAWQLESNTSPISLTSLLETRYIKWKATLTTSDTSQTPILHEVRVIHYPGLASEHIVLNEFLPNPSGTDPDYGFDFGEDGDLMPKGDWVEIYNKTGGKTVDLAGWYIKDQEGNIVNITSLNTSDGSTIISSEGWLVVYLNMEMLNNDGDTVYLYDMFDNLIDSHSYDLSSYCTLEPTPEDTNDGETPALICPTEVPGNKSYARIPDGTGSWFDPIPTPGRQNELEEIVVEEEVAEEENIEEEISGEEIIPEEETPIEEEVITEEYQEEVIIDEILNEIVEEILPETEPTNEEPITEEIIPEPEVNEEQPIIEENNTPVVEPIESSPADETEIISAPENNPTDNSESDVPESSESESSNSTDSATSDSIAPADSESAMITEDSVSQ